MKREWHTWWAWYPVYSIQYGWVLFRYLHRKQIPDDYVDMRYPWVVSWSEKFSEKITGCWHRVPD